MFLPIWRRPLQEPPTRSVSSKVEITYGLVSLGQDVPAGAEGQEGARDGDQFATPTACTEEAAAGKVCTCSFPHVQHALSRTT